MDRLYNGKHEGGTRLTKISVTSTQIKLSYPCGICSGEHLSIPTR